MRILFVGSGEFGVPCLRMLHEDGHQIISVVTQPDRPAGRGKAPRPTPIRQFSGELGLSSISPENINESGIVDRIRLMKTDLCVVIAFGQKIGRSLLEAFPVGIINLHGSLLPRWRGAAPIQRAIMNGDEEVGVTVFRLAEKMDAGPILSQRRTGLKAAETADELHDRLAAIGCDALRAAIERLSRDPADPGDVQDESGVTMAPKLQKEEGWIDFAQPAARVECLINGLYSWPGARCRFVSQGGRSEEVVLARAMADDRSTGTTEPGRIGSISERGGVLTASGEIAVMEIQPAGGRVMNWQAFVNGRHVKPGDRMERIGASGVGVREGGSA